MKKLILLAVVVFGFTAISVGQPVTSGAALVTGGVLAPTSLNKDMAIAYSTPLTFGTVTSSPLYDGTLLVKANGQVVKTNVTAGTGVAPASFKVTGLKSGTPIITLGKTHWGIGYDGITLDIIQDDPDYVQSIAGTNAGEFTVKVGALLTIPAKTAINDFTGITGFTVTLNNN